MQRVFAQGLRASRLFTQVLSSKQSTPVYSFIQNRNFCISKIHLNMAYTISERGGKNTLEFRAYFKDANGDIVSPFHDIPLVADKAAGTFNMVVEVPRWTNAKMEIDTKSPMNPIKQDVKKEKLRFVNNCFPHHGYIWNYGCLPQTWEDPNEKDEHTQQNGDNDPIDVCEIGYKVHSMGSVIQVKPLGVMALIDEGETDWKIIAIDVNDPLAEKLHDIDDVEKHMPGFIKATHEWFKIYKVPTGKPLNEFAFNGEAKNKEFALKVIDSTNEQWKKLMTKQAEAGKLALQNIAVDDSPFKISKEEANKSEESSPAPGPAAAIAPEVDMWHYVKL